MKRDFRHNSANEKQRFSIRKLTIGAASVLLGTTLLWANGNQVKADENTNADANDNNTQTSGQSTDDKVTSPQTGNTYTTESELAKQKAETTQSSEITTPEKMGGVKAACK